MQDNAGVGKPQGTTWAGRELPAFGIWINNESLQGNIAITICSPGNVCPPEYVSQTRPDSIPMKAMQSAHKDNLDMQPVCNTASTTASLLDTILSTGHPTKQVVPQPPTQTRGPQNGPCANSAKTEEINHHPPTRHHHQPYPPRQQNPPWRRPPSPSPPRPWSPAPPSPGGSCSAAGR